MFVHLIPHEESSQHPSISIQKPMVIPTFTSSSPIRHNSFLTRTGIAQ